MRSQWNEPNAVFVGFKGGDNRTNHGHLDVGSFVLDADGVRWALDLGGDGYHLPGYFGRERFQYYRLNTRSHNTLLINGQVQDASAVCPIVSFHSTPERANAIVDMTNAYRGEATDILRGIELLDRQVVHVRDEIVGAEGVVRWAMVTKASIAITDNMATLRQGGKVLRARILAPLGGRFEVLPNRPPTKMETQNDGTSILAIQIDANTEKLVEISVLLEPENTNAPPSTPPILTLRDWPKS